MNLEKQIKDKLMLTIIYKKNKSKENKLEFFLAGAIKADVDWGNKKETIDLLEKIKVQRFTTLKSLLGKEFERRMIEKKLKEEWIYELIKKMTAGIERIIKLKSINGKKFKTIKI